MDDEESGDGGKRVKSVERSFSVVDVLRSEGTVRIEDVARALDCPTSTAHVHLKTLESVGYVVQDEQGYRLSCRFLRDGIVARDRLPIYDAAKPEVHSLADETGEVANLGVEENGRRVILYQAEGTEAVYDNAPIGEYTRMHWTALGKAILAHFSNERIDEIVEANGLPDRRENTITDVDRLYDELATIRDRNYAIEDEERRDGIRSVAVPVMAEDVVLGALSISGPKERFNDDYIQSDLLPKLRDSANVVEIKAAYE